MLELIELTRWLSQLGPQSPIFQANYLVESVDVEEEVEGEGVREVSHVDAVDHREVAHLGHPLKRFCLEVLSNTPIST